MLFLTEDKWHGPESKILNSIDFVKSTETQEVTDTQKTTKQDHHAWETKKHGKKIYSSKSSLDKLKKNTKRKHLIDIGPLIKKRKRTETLGPKKKEKKQTDF